MNPELYFAFVAATAVMILLPGPSVMLTVAHGMAFGPRGALVTLTGIVSGISVQLAITLAGMTSFMIFMTEWFEVLRWAGVAYLVYLGIQQWRADPTAPDLPNGSASSPRSRFLQGLVITVMNPKSMIFLAAFFPQFIDPAVPLSLQLPVLSVTFVAIAFVFTGLWLIPAGQAARWFRSASRARWRNRITGSLILGAGVGLALARRA